jgi:hypothetical protein
MFLFTFMVLMAIMVFLTFGILLFGPPYALGWNI